MQDVFVAKHDQVDAGQIVLQMDVSLETAQRESLKQTQRDFQEENQIIQHILSHQDLTSFAPITAAGASNLERHHQAEIQVQQQKQKARNLGLQIDALAKKIDIATRQLDLMQQRMERQSELVESGHLSITERESLTERTLILKADIEGDRASLISLRGQQSSASDQAELIGISTREHFMRTWDANVKRLHEISRQITELNAKIEEAVVRAPAAGIVSNIFFKTKGSFAARGETLISLTQPLAHPHISFEVPVGQIDQLQPGMEGRLILTSLPQRTMPKIDVRVVAVSPRATLNEHGIPVSYTGRAEIQSEDIEHIIASMSAAALQEDMPVQLLISARETTLASYIYRPFVEGIRTAVQD